MNQPKDALAEYIRAHPCKGFRPKLIYHELGDFLEYYWENADCYAEGTPFVGLVTMRAMNDQRVVGFKVFGAKELGHMGSHHMTIAQNFKRDAKIFLLGLNAGLWFIALILLILCRLYP